MLQVQEHIWGNHHFNQTGTCWINKYLQSIFANICVNNIAKDNTSYSGHSDTQEEEKKKKERMQDLSGSEALKKGLSINFCAV